MCRQVSSWVGDHQRIPAVDCFFGPFFFPLLFSFFVPFSTYSIHSTLSVPPLPLWAKKGGRRERKGDEGGFVRIYVGMYVIYVYGGIWSII